MKYKWKDKVRIKSKKELECISEVTDDMLKKGGAIMTIACLVEDADGYIMKEDGDFHFLWSDEMIEGLVEEENNHLTETVVDTVRESNDRYRIVIDPRFDIEVDEGEYYVVRRKKEYPKTYEECCNVLQIKFFTQVVVGYKYEILSAFQKLLICRDAYWKIAGEEMGLDKPWEPDWKNSEERRYSIVNIEGDINLPEKTLTKWILKVTNKILVFPTEEMRDAFYENFKEEIEICKELL